MTIWALTCLILLVICCVLPQSRVLLPMCRLHYLLFCAWSFLCTNWQKRGARLYFFSVLSLQPLWILPSKALLQGFQNLQFLYCSLALTSLKSLKSKKKKNALISWLLLCHVVKCVALVVAVGVAQIKAEALTRARSLHHNIFTLKITIIAHVGCCATRAREAHFASGAWLVQGLGKGYLVHSHPWYFFSTRFSRMGSSLSDSAKRRLE